MLSSRWPTTLVFGLLLALLPRLATAQQAEAEQRFRDGKKLMAEKQYAQACDAFETSNRLDPQVATLMNLADCREKNGQLQSAWTAFLEVERQTRGDAKLAALNQTAKERAAKLEPRLSYLTVSVARDNEVEGLTLTRNGQSFDPGLWNTAIPVDGGRYVIAGRAPGHEEWSTTVTVPAEGGRVSVDVPRFKAVRALVEPPPTKIEDAVVLPAPSRLTGRRKLALGVGAAGLLAAGGGIVLGVQATGFDDDATAACPSLTGCTRADEANALVGKAEQRALYANVAFGVAGVAVIAAATLWLTGAPDEAPAVAPIITSTSAGLDFTVRF